MKQFREIDFTLQGAVNIDDWWKLYEKLTNWQIKFDKYRDTGLDNILIEQINQKNLYL